MSKIEPCSRLSSAELKTESMLPRCLSWVEEREQRTEDVQVCSEMLRNVLDHDCHDHLYPLPLSKRPRPPQTEEPRRWLVEDGGRAAASSCSREREEGEMRGEDETRNR